jgi:hypothetical protein
MQTTTEGYTCTKGDTTTRVDNYFYRRNISVVRKDSVLTAQ